MKKLIITMNGLGDSIFQRPFIQRLIRDGHKVWVSTTWPELFSDLDVGLVKRQTNLRTQLKNQLKSDHDVWTSWPSDAIVSKIQYGHSDLANGSIFGAMRKCFGVEPLKMTLPSFHGPIRKPYIVVRPVTARKEWMNPARNPHPEYIERAVRKIREFGIKVVGVADLQDEEEWLVGNDFEVDIKLYRGELGVTSLLGLVENAEACIGGVGWLLPAAIAYKTPMLCILGGNGGHNHPSKVTDSTMDLSNLQWVFPDRFCGCSSMRHICDKTISHFDWSLDLFLKNHLHDIASKTSE